MSTLKSKVVTESLTAPSLASVLDQSEQITDNVKECAAELSSVNSTLKGELTSRPVPPRVDAALQESEIIENKIQDCAEDLVTLNQALEEEVEKRRELEHELNTTKELEETARHAAFHDPLTSLPNRALFDDRLEHGMSQAKRHGRLLAVLFIDLDNFKSINDTHGHLAGDQVLQSVAERLTRTMRAEDTVSRHGGDEFLYLLLELENEQDATRVAQKIIRTIGQPCDITVNEVVIGVTITPSIGIAVFPKDGVTAESLVKSADKAMYRAKQSKLDHARTSAI